MSSPTVVGALLVFVLGIAGGKERCNCNFISHPQTQFCQSSYAVHGVIHGAASVPAPGEPDFGERNNKYLRYNVSVVEVYKGHNFLMSGDHVFIFTPRLGLCGKNRLYQSDPREAGDNQYLITGDTSTSASNEEFLVATNCNWILPWDEITTEQIEGLRGAYEECNWPDCTVSVAVAPLDIPGARDEDKFSRVDCRYNPIGATQLSVPDCETDHGICLRMEEQGCQWLPTPGYEECYNSRRDRLGNAAAAITLRKDCSILSGKQKKKCLLRLLKSKASQI